MSRIDQLMCGAIAACAVSSASAALALPDGIVVEEYVDGLLFPVSIAPTPSGDVLVTEKLGTVRLVRDGEVLEDPVLEVDVLVKNEAGLLGIEVMPDFEESGRFVITYTPASDPESIYLSRFELDGDVATAVDDPWLVMPSEPDTDRHYGGNVHFHDDQMYVALSELDIVEYAQDLDRPNGSILRYELDLSIPDDNPFSGSAIWAYGLRNTFDFDISSDGVVWGAENGPHHHDEVNRLERGGNYGFPIVLGYCDHYPAVEPCGDADLRDPAHEFRDRTGPTGVVVYEGDLMPQFADNVFVGGWHSGELHRFEVNEDGGLREMEQFFVPPEGVYTTYPRDDRLHLEAFGIVDAVEAADGALLVLLSGTNYGTIYRIAPEASVLDADAIRDEGEAREVVPESGCAQSGGWPATPLGLVVVLCLVAAWRRRRRSAAGALVALLLVASPADAQELHLGARGGPNLGTFVGDNTFAMGFAPGLTVGPSMRFDPIRYFGLGADLLYSLRGASNEFTHARATVHELSVPLMIEGMLPIGRVTLRVAAGGFGSLTLAATQAGDSFVDKLNRLNGGLLGGVGVDVRALNGRLTFDARFDRSLSNLYDPAATPEWLTTPSNQQSGFHFLLGYLY